MRKSGRGEDIRKEHIKQRICETNQHPRKPNQDGREGHLLAGEQATDVDHGLTKREATTAVGRADFAAGLKSLESQRTRPVVLLRQLFEVLDQLLILTGSEKILGSLFEPDDEDTCQRHAENQRTASKHGVSPAPIACLGTGRVSFTVGGAIPLARHQKAPCNKAGDGLTETPPSCHESHQPLLVAREVFEKDGCIHDKVATTSEAKKGNEEGQTRPVGHSAADDAGDGANEERDVKGILAPNDIGAETPEKRSGKHTAVDRNGEGIFEPLVSKLGKCLFCNNRLEE